MKFFKITSYVLGLTVLGTSSCNKELEKHQTIVDDPVAPAQVSNITVTNGNGTAVISYTVPDDPRLMYVKAVYTITTGEEYETLASYYNNSLELEGFADTLEHEVKLYSVSRAEVISDPIVVKIKPLESPIWKVRNSIEVENAFGGYNLTAVNPSQSNVSIIVLKKNVFDEFEPDNDMSVYTKADSISSKIRGLDTVTYRFGYVVKDRWGNTTDTLFQDIVPLYETQFPTSTFSAFVLPGDAPQVTNGAALNYAWDGQYGWPWTSFTDQVAGGSGPHTITFDMGRLGKVSRFWYRPYQEWGGQYYYLTTLRYFEVWGSASPSLSGVYDNTWVLLGTFTITKPSGLPYGTDDANDQAVAAAGMSFELDINAPRVRYIRVRCLENWAGGTAQNINELAVYGDPR